MKLAQILYSGLGGHGSVAFSLASAAPDTWQHEMCFFGIEPLLPEYARTCSDKGFGAHYIPVARGRAWMSWRALIRELDRMRPEAILLHSVKTILPVWAYAKRRGIPLVAVEHQPNALKKRSEWVVSHLLMRLADAVVLLTPTYQEELQARLQGAWRADKVSLIPNGIDTDLYRPLGREILQQPIRVGMAARFSNRKRQDLLIDTMQILNQERPGLWHLSLAGDGDELPRLRARIEALGLQDVIDLPGYLGEQALCDWFGGLDIYTHASDGETLSTSLLQALSCGLPILGSHVEGIANFLSQGDGVGLLANEETATGFAQGLRRLAEDRQLAQDLSVQARALACCEYSHHRMFERYAALLQR